MNQSKIPPMPDENEIPTMENIERRLRAGSRLTGSAVVITDGADGFVDLTLSLKVGDHPESPLGTLVTPLCDYPILIALLTVGATMLRVDFQYQAITANSDWRAGSPVSEADEKKH